MKDRDPYHDALTALAAFAGSGRFAWGEPLVATALAGELGLSPTPVREALARLSGEGLIEHRPGRGYYAPSPSADDVVELYELHRRLVHWALDLLERDGWQGTSGPVDGSSAERLFGSLTRTAGRAVLLQAHWRVTLQLRPIRTLETRVAPEDPAWLVQAMPLLVAQDIAGLRAVIDVYHRDRTANAPAIVSDMRRAAQNISQV